MTLISERDAVTASEKRKKLLWLFGVVTAVFVTVAVLLLLLSPDKYIPFLIADIVISVAYGFFAVYFFGVSYYEVNSLHKLHAKLGRATLSKEYGTYLKSSGCVTKDGVTMLAELFEVNGVERELLCLGEFAFAAGTMYVLESKANVLIRAEVRDLQ